MKRYKLLQKYNTPVCTVEPGIYTENHLQCHFGYLSFDQYPDWFEEVPTPVCSSISWSSSITSGHSPHNNEFTYHIKIIINPIDPSKLQEIINKAIENGELC